MSSKKRSSKATLDEMSDNEKENTQNLSAESGSASKKRAANDSPAPTRPKKSQKKSKGDTPGQGAQAEEEQEKKGKKRRRSEPGSPKKTKKKRKSDGDGSNLSEEVLNLFEIMKSRNAALAITTDEWLKTYDEDKESATFSLVNFIVQSCGSTATLARDEFDTFEPNDDIKAILRRLSEETGLEAEGGEYPIVSRKQTLKKFKANFMEFWKKLISQCSKTVLYDGYFLPQLIGWVNAISENDIRTFRHTATVIGLQIVRSLCTVGASLRNQLETNDRLLNAENKKKDGDKSKVASLTKKSKQLNKNIAAIEEHLTDLFEHIFAHRYRDIFPDIRSACIEALGQWMLEYPAFFLTDNHLRYFGWLISDKVGEVRITALKSMQKLYAKDDIRQQLDNFTQYFKSRIIQTVEDKVAAIDSITLNGQLAEAELLDEDDVNRIYALVSDESAAIRFAAGEFIFQHLLSKTGTDPSNPDHDAQLRAMLDFIEEKTQHAELPNYVVDALWGKATVLKDWAAMTNLLLTESQKKALSDSQQTLLVRILNCSVKKACGEKIVPKTKADPDHKDKKEAIQESKSKLSEHLVKALPQVLQKFKADKEKTADLVEIPQYFDLGVYSTFRLTTQHKELLKLLQEIFNKSVDAYTFRNIAKTLAYLQTENENARQTDVAINELSDAAFAKFRSALDNAESEESEEELALTLALQRLAELTKYLGLAHLDELFDSIENALQGNLAAQGEECLMRALDILFYQLAWARSKIDPNRPDTDAIDALVRKRDAVFKLLEKYLKNKSVAIAEKSFLVANDMLIMFSKSMRDAKTSLSALGYLPSTALVTQMRGFFADEVTNKQTFRDDEDEMARKEKLITALAKSIAFNALHADNAPAVLCNFVSHGKFVEEIVKTFLHKLREKYKDNEYRVILETLKIKYEQVESSITEGEAVTVPTSPQKKKKSKSKKTDDEEDQEKDKEEGDDLEEDDEDTASRTPLRALERLSKRLADTYGIPTQRHEWLRRSLYQVVKNCVYYAIEDFPSRVNFFRAALFFLSKLDAPSARILRDDFNRKTADLEIDEFDHKIRPFLTFKDKLERLASGEKGSPAKKKAAASKKQSENVRKKLDFTKSKQSKDSEEDENNEEEEALEDKRKTKGKKGGKKQAQEEEDEPEETTSTKKKGAKGKGKKKQADEEEVSEEEPQQKKGKKSTNSSRVQSIYSEEEAEKSAEKDNSDEEEQLRESIFGNRRK